MHHVMTGYYDHLLPRFIGAPIVRFAQTNKLRAQTHMNSSGIKNGKQSDDESPDNSPITRALASFPSLVDMSRAIVEALKNPDKDTSP